MTTLSLKRGRKPYYFKTSPDGKFFVIPGELIEHVEALMCSNLLLFFQASREIERKYNLKIMEPHWSFYIPPDMIVVFMVLFFDKHAKVVTLLINFCMSYENRVKLYLKKNTFRLFFFLLVFFSNKISAYK